MKRKTVDQYEEWAGQVVEKMPLPVAGDREAIRQVVAAALRGVAIEALDHAESVIAAAARKEIHEDRRAGVVGARMVIRALSMAIKSPLNGDVKPVEGRA